MCAPVIGGVRAIAHAAAVRPLMTWWLTLVGGLGLFIRLRRYSSVLLDRCRCCSSARSYVIDRFTVGCDSGDVAVAAVHFAALWLGDGTAVVVTPTGAHVSISTPVKSAVSNRFEASCYSPAMYMSRYCSWVSSFNCQNTLPRVSRNNEKKTEQAVPDSNKSNHDARLSPKSVKCRFRGVGSVLLSHRGVGRKNERASS